DNTVAFWDTASGKSQAQVKDQFQPIRAINLSPQGKWLAIRCEDSSWHLYGLPEQNQAFTFVDRDQGIVSLAFSHDDKVVALGREHGMIQLLETVTAETTARWPGHSEAVTSLAFSSDGKVLAAGSKDHTVKLWHIPSEPNRVVSR